MQKIGVIFDPLLALFYSDIGHSLLLLIGIFIYEMNWPKWALIYVYGYLGNAKSWFLKSYHVVLLRAAKTVRPRLPNQPDLPALARLPSKGQCGRILKIMILHCPSTHKHRLVFILSSSFRIWISPLEVTVSQISESSCECGFSEKCSQIALPLEWIFKATSEFVIAIQGPH